DQTLTSQPLGPGAPTSQRTKKVSPPAKAVGQQPAKKPGAGSEGGQAATEPVARGGVQVFIDPTTGQITDPTDAQLQQLNQQNPSANMSFGQTDVVERPSLIGGGMTADVPASLFPVVTAAIGADGKVTIEERRAQSGDKGAIGQGPKVGQSSQSGVGQRLS